MRYYTPYQGQKTGDGVRNSVLILLLGIGLGIWCKWLDNQMSALFAEVKSEVSLWVLLAAVTALYSRTAKRAALNVLLLLGGIMGAYCLMAVLTNSMWGTSFLIGWGIAALLSPIAGYFVWFAKGRSRRAWLLCAGVLAVQIALVTVLIRTVRIVDVVFILLTAVVLLLDKFGRR